MTTSFGRRRAWQPPITAKLDPHHLLATGLVRCYLSDGASWVDLANGGRRMTRGSDDRLGPRFGRFGKATSQWATDPRTPATGELGSRRAITLVCAVTCGTFDRGNTAGITMLFGDEKVTDDHTFLRFGDDLVSPSLFQFVSSLAKLTSTTSFNVGQSYVVAGRQNASGMSLWVNGVREASNATTDTSNQPASAPLINSQTAEATRKGIHGVHIALWYRRSLNDTELATLAVDPFCMLRW